MSKRTFYIYKRRDPAITLPFISALVSAGYEETMDMSRADFLLYDYERSTFARPFAHKPVFIYPHTPYAFWLWDGLIRPRRAKCNFVVTEAAVQAMKRYGYPHRAEAVGFSLAEVKPFAATSGKDLLFAPAHPLTPTKGFPRPADAAIHKNALRWIVTNRAAFDRVVVRYAFDLSHYGFEEFLDSDIEFIQADELRVQNSLDFMRPFDIVISCGTFGYLSLAAGKPTILYGYKDVIPGNRRADVKSYDLYRDMFEFPCPLESLTSADVLAARSSCDRIESWKERNIGGSFDAEKFISIIRECVR